MRAQNACATPLRSLFLTAMLVAITPLAHSDASSEAKALLNTKCAACHLPVESLGMNRIDQSRRTPEGWDMTIDRMIGSHGVRVTPEERQKLVKYLADTRGLSPEEVSGYRYLLERDFTLVEEPDDKLVAGTCARCHSYGRIALQRRTEEDWIKLASFHVGQFPTIEIQASGRDRNWWDLASKDVPKVLAKLYPLGSDSWSKWQQYEPISPAGTWRVVGHRPGLGAYEGVATVESAEPDNYRLNMQLIYKGGKKESAEGEAVVYTGYEWRASLKQGVDDVRQVFTLSPDGQTLSGRWHKVGVDSIGGRLHAVRSGKGSAERLLMVDPTYIKAGTTQRVTIYGNNLSGSLDLGAGIKIVSVIEQSPDKVVVDALAAGDAQAGLRTIGVGTARLEQAIALYQEIDYLVIEPEQAMAHIGGNGGSRPKIPVQFESVGYAFGSDGKQGTEDDIRLGYMPATWSVENLNAYAEKMRDKEFAGVLQPDGLFIPGDAGPNPERTFSTNNAGDLKVTAVVDDAGRKIKATKPFVVTVQRWNDPAIR